MTSPVVTIRSWRRSVRGPGGPALAVASAVTLAAALTAYMLWLVVPHDGGSVAAGLVAVTMTAPIAWARRAPATVGAVLAVAVAVNELWFGHLVRCGPALPAAFFVAFACGRVAGRRRWFGLAATTASLIVQCVYDPRLGVSATALMIPLGLAFFGGGAYVSRRAGMVQSLRAYTASLREQREQVTDLAIAADRDQLTDRLNHTLRQQIDAISRALATPGSDRDRFATVEQLGRQSLDTMRELVGSLRESPMEPEPGLADLFELCTRSTTADVSLAVDGVVRPLPASIELSACRIVEQLLRVLVDQPAARVQLRVDFAVAGLDIALSGAPTHEVDVPHVRALATARAAIHGGTVDITDGPGQRRARVHLPLVSAHG